MKKMQKGFTLIELLVVIAIIGILSSVVVTSMSSARTKAKTAAFQAEASGITPGLVSKCDVGNIVLADFGSPTTYTPTMTGFTQSCGPSGSGTFSQSITATNGATLKNGTGTGTATVTETGAVFQ